MKTTAKRLLSAILAAAMAVTSTGLTVSAEDLGIGGVSGITVGSSITVGTSGVSIDKENFPDDIFRNYVFSEFDSDKNGRLSDKEINNATSITIGFSSVESLKGVEHFTSLTYLECGSNKLTSLDVSKNTALRYLDCSDNQLTSLDASNNPNLENLYCNSNQLTSLVLSSNTALELLWCFNNKLSALDISKNTALTHLDCTFNEITSLDLSAQTSLKSLECDRNKLKSLDVSSCQALEWLSCSGNQLTSLDLESCPGLSNLTTGGNEYVLSTFSLNELAQYGFDPLKASNWTGAEYDSDTNSLVNVTSNAVTYSYDAGQEYTVEFILITSEIAVAEINEENFPDENFREYVLENFDRNSDGVLSVTETRQTYIDVNGKSIESLKGIEHFNNLRYLYCHNNLLTSLDLSGFEKLEVLYCFDNALTSLDVSDCAALVSLYCLNNSIESLDLSGNPLLTELNAVNNKLTSLDVSNCTQLTELYCEQNCLTSLDVSNNTLLEKLVCSANQLTDLDVSGNTKLTVLYCSENLIEELDVSSCPDLERFYCDGNKLTDLDVTSNTKLKYFYCDGNELTDLVVSDNRELVELICSANKLTALDVSGLSKLTRLECGQNKLAFIDLSENTALADFSCEDCVYELSSYSLEELEQLGFDISKTSDWDGAGYNYAKNRLGFIESTEVTYTYDIGNGKSQRFTLIIPELADLPLPEVTASSTMDSVTLSWNEIDMADSYVVYGFTAGGTTELCVTDDLSCTIDGLESGTKYSFVVCAVNGKTVSEFTENDVITISTKRPLPVTPTVKTAVDDKTVILSWEAVPNADSYTIYKYENGKYTKITSTEKTSCSVTDLVNGTEYKFLVRAFNESGGSKFTTADIVAATPMAKPAKPVVKATVSDGAVTLTWGAVPTAASYAIYRYENGKYTKITATTATSCAVTGLTNGTEYKFLVRAFNAAGGNAFTTADLVAATPVAKPAKPAVTAVSGNKQVALSWKAVPTATYYTVYKYDSGSYIKLASTTGTSYTATDLTNGTTYKFLVRAFNAAGGNAFTTADLVAATPKAPEPPAKPTNVKAAAGDKQVTLSWTASAGAASYTIYKYENSKYVKIDSTTKTSYTVTGLANGTAYKFLVRAFSANGGSAFTTADLVSATPKGAVPAKPTNVKAAAGDKQVTLSWTASAGAASYTIYKYENSKYTKITSTTSTSYTVTGLTNGTAYKFLVRAFNANGGSAFTTADLVTATPKAAPATVPAKPTVSANVGDKVVTFSWNAVAGADYYKLYSYSNGKYGLIEETTDTSYRLRYLTNGTTYQILVRAFNEKGGSPFTTADLISVTPKAATAVPEKVTAKATVSGGNVILTWAHIPTAFSYTIYKYENGTYTKLGATSDNSFTVKGLAAGKTYKLLVRAFNSKGGNKVSTSDLVAVTL